MDVNEKTVELTGDRMARLIKGYSNVAYEISATAKKNASITSYKATCNGLSKNTSSGTFDKVGASSFVFSATDNRGLSKSMSFNLLLVDYFKPTVNATCELELDTATTVRANIKISGTFFNGSFGAVNNSLEILIKHSAANDWISLQKDLFFDYSTNGNNYSIDFGVSNLDYTQPFSYQVKVVDALETATSAEDTLSYLPLFDWSETDFNFNVPINMNGKQVLRYTAENKVVLSANGDIYLRPNGSTTDTGQLRLFTDGKATLNGKQIATVDMIYPVGAIYMSVNSTNPSTIFGGTWEQLKDRFLLGAGSTYTAGNTGGSATHTLTAEQIPAHTHSVPNIKTTGSGDGAYCESWGGGSGPRAINTGSTGGGKAHNNMPPYLVVYMWKRTA
jgi:hypothetical protein